MYCMYILKVFILYCITCSIVVPDVLWMYSVMEIIGFSIHKFHFHFGKQVHFLFSGTCTFWGKKEKGLFKTIIRNYKCNATNSTF